MLNFQPGLPFLLARVESLADPVDESIETEARALNIKRLAMEAIRLLPEGLGPDALRLSRTGEWVVAPGGAAA